MSNKAGIVNNISVDVFNANGTLAQHEEGHNFVSINLKKFGELLLREFLTNAKEYNQTYSMYHIANTYQYEGVNAMYCTDDTSTESPTTEVTIPGNTVAYATLQSAFAQTTGTRGSVSEALSICDNKKAKFVCEWNESTGNGTFQSVCLGNKNIGIIPEMIAYDNDVVQKRGMAYGGGYYWTSQAGTKIIEKLNATTFAVEETIDLSSDLDSNIIDLTYHNGTLYISGTGIYSYVISTGVVTEITGSNAFGLATDGSYLYASSSSSSEIITKISFAGATVESKSVPDVSVGFYGLTYYNGLIYFADSNRKIGTFNWSTEESNVFGSVECKNIYGITNNGSEVIYNVQHIIYQGASAEYTTSFAKIDTTSARDMFNRVLLPSSVTKAQGQTMTVTCTITFS